MRKRSTVRIKKGQVNKTATTPTHKSRLRDVKSKSLGRAKPLDSKSSAITNSVARNATTRSMSTSNISARAEAQSVADFQYSATVFNSPPTVSEPPETETAEPLHSSIDSISDRGISGWAMMPTQPSYRCVVGLRVSKQLVGRAIASTFRSDLLSAGIGDGCHSFLMPMPRTLLDGQEHVLELIELNSGTALSAQPIRWRSTAGTAEPVLTSMRSQPARIAKGSDPVIDRARSPDVAGRIFSNNKKSVAGEGKAVARGASRRIALRVLFDVSDLVYYIGHHPNLTGIQRVQSSIILSIVQQKLLTPDSLVLLSFNARHRHWSMIPTGFFISLLEDLLLPEQDRLIPFPVQDAREGILPGSSEFDGIGLLDDGAPSVLCLLGAAWVQRDYFHRLLNLKRQFGMKAVVTIHDLIPIYARDTCDQGTAIVFEQFLRRALRHTDHFLCVSEYTAKDLKRYAASLAVPCAPITVTRNGSSFEEFLPKAAGSRDLRWDGLPERFVLFVATIEGRKNHRLIFEIWRRMVEAGDDPPHLICVGRVGWKSDAFISGLVETNYLEGRVVLMKEVSDAQLKVLYHRSMFSLCPSIYEGWGLPVGESLAAGKVCVCSDRASIPEVAGDCGVYIDVNDVDKSYATIRSLCTDSALLAKMTAKVRRSYQPITWGSVAERIVEACRTATKTEAAATPFVLVPYSSEISFATPPGRDSEGIFGEDLVARVVEARKGLFLFESLPVENFLRGEDARAGKNWGEPENWGTWLCHAGGELLFDLPASGASLFYIFLRLRASGPLSDLRVRISANGSTLWSDCIGPNPRNIMLRVRGKGRTSSAWRMRLQAEAQLTPELRERIVAIDGRIPTIGFERMVVVPEDDLKARLDVLTALMV